MKKVLSLTLAVLMIASMALGFSSCTKKAKYTIGISQFAPHEALDAATKGFMDTLKAEFGDDVAFDVQNAAGDTNTASTIASNFVSKKVDLILANATPCLQAVANATETIPVLGTSVTEYGVALGINNFNGVTGINVSGTSDLAPLDQQAQMIVDLFPSATTVGILYCSAEANSKYQVDVVKGILEGKSLTVKTYTFSDSNDVSAVTTKAADECNVIYIPTDNTAANCSATIGGIIKNKKVPVIAGESGICKECGVATLSIDYYELGVKTGEMAIKILKGEANIAEMKIEYANASKFYNAEICTMLGIAAPTGYTALAD